MKVFSIAGHLIPIVRLVSLTALVAIMFPLSAFCGSDKLVESDDYKNKDFHKGCITDYKELVKGDDIDWVWISPGVKLADYSLSIVKFENLSDEIRSSQVDDIKSVFKEILGKLKGDKGSLSASMCIYEVQKFSPGKAWIPYAGGHLMQAGVGVEMILTDKGKTVATIRHFAREGSRLEDAADETAKDLKKYISKN
jgi:hypothetical protein